MKTFLHFWRKMITKTNALLTLFNAVQVKDKVEKVYEFDQLEKMIKNGFIVEPHVKLTNSLFNEIESHIGIGGEKLNRSFHKSWQKVATAPMVQLVMEQLVHYITTYGYESLGIYSEDSVFLPFEKLDVPENFKNIPLVIVRGLTSEEILNKIVSLGASGVALSEQTLDCIMEIVESNSYDEGWVSEIQNRELRTRLFEHYDIVPDEPVAWLRYVIYKLTGESLLIKNTALIEKIKASKETKLLDKFILSAPKNLSSIFLRYKPLFLAMKNISRNKTFFNQLRKKAEFTHKAVGEDYLNSVTGSISNGTFKLKEFKEKISGYSVWRKVRLAYALRNRLLDLDSIIYRVRNGKGWVSEYSGNSKVNRAKIKGVLQETLKSIAESIEKNVSGKTFYIPSYVSYALPASEKQFVGNIPANTSVSVGEEDMVVGVHWKNNINQRVDLDLSLIDATGKYGWDAKYRSGDKKILFSGDMTDAPIKTGASEMFYISGGVESDGLLSVNYFNYSENFPVDFCQVFVSYEKVRVNSFGEGMRRGSSYMLDPEKILISLNIPITERQTSLAVVSREEGKVYFITTALGNSISSRVGNFTNMSKDFLLKTCKATIDMRDILEMAGANVVSEVPEEGVDYTDLSPEALDKTTFIGMFS